MVDGLVVGLVVGALVVDGLVVPLVVLAREVETRVVDGPTVVDGLVVVVFVVEVDVVELVDGAIVVVGCADGFCGSPERAQSTPSTLLFSQKSRRSSAEPETALPPW